MDSREDSKRYSRELKTKGDSIRVEDRTETESSLQWKLSPSDILAASRCSFIEGFRKLDIPYLHLLESFEDLISIQLLFHSGKTN